MFGLLSSFAGDAAPNEFSFESQQAFGNKRKMNSLNLAVIVLLLLVLSNKVHSNPIASSTPLDGHFGLEQDLDYNSTLLVISNGGSTAPSTEKSAKMRQQQNTHAYDQSEPPIASAGGFSSSSSVAQFNERRRDMFLEDYSNSIKQIEVVDTSANSTSAASAQQPAGPTIIVIQHPPPQQPQVQSQQHQSSLVTSNTMQPKLTPVASASTPAMTISVTPSVNGGTPSITYTLNETKRTTYHQKEEEQNHREEHSQQQEHHLEIQPQRNNVLMPRIEPSIGRPACVKSADDTFCEMVESYPKNAIKEEITITRSQFTEIFGQKEMDGRTSPIEDNINEEAVCRKLQRMIYPQMAKNQANQWIYVVNEVEYAQAVVAEVCEKPGKSCAYLDQNLPPGMYSRCKQKYSYKRLLALHPTEKRTYSDSFKFPSCCSCYIKFDDVVARSGFRKIDTSARPEVIDNGRIIPNGETTIGGGIMRERENEEREGQTRDTRSSSSTPARSRSRVGEAEPALTRSRILDRVVKGEETPIYYSNQTTSQNIRRSTVNNNNYSRIPSRMENTGSRETVERD